MWIVHPGFQQVVDNAWNLSSSIQLVISSFKSLATFWNKEVLGNIFAQKRNLIARIGGFQKALASRPLAFFISLEQELSLKYAAIFNQEEKFQALKSRVDQQIFGDRNTAFFHIKTITRRNHNNIRRIKNIIGDWVDSKEQVMDIILKGFIDLYQSQHLTSISPSDFEVDWAISLSDDDSKKLSCNFTSHEIHKSMFFLQPFKAPGMDGLYNGFFFQNFQHTIGPSIIEEIQSIFSP